MKMIKKFKRFFTGLLTLSFMLSYAVPAGICATLPSLPKSIQGGNKNLSFTQDIKISSANPPITLSLRNSDVKQVLRMFADKAGKNIIFHSSLDDEQMMGNGASQQGNGQSNVVSNITMDLVEVPLNEAFKMVLEVANLTYFLQGNTLIIMSIDAAKTSAIGRQDMMVLPVQYLDASKVADFLNRNIYSAGKPGLSSAEIAVTNPERNELILFGNQNDYQIAKKVLEQFDIKPNEETFIVNHTTPREMSQMICRVLFKDLAKLSSDQSVVLTAEDYGNDDDDDDNNNNNNNNNDKTDKVEVGKGTVACQFRSPAQTSGNGQGQQALSSLDTGGLTIVYFGDRGTIYARGGTKLQMEQIRDFIAENDRRQFQAYLEMSIIELNESGSKEFSNTWNIYSGFFTGSFDNNLAHSTPTFIKGDEIPAMFQDPNNPSLPRYTGLPVVTYAINYLIQNGKGRVLANPRILITSGKKANINITSSYVRKVTSQVMDTVSSLSGAVQKTYDIGNDLGIKIELQPYISPDGYVTMNIIPSYSTIKEQVTEPRTLVTNATLGTTEVVNDLMATLIDKRELNLKNIRIKDGETMVIGGMLKETETKRVYKFPILGDIPLIGMLFRSTTAQKEKNELVIMLTPRIIQDSIENIQEKATL